MKRLVVLLAVAGLMAGSAMAQDEGPNSLGLYFDDAGDDCYMMNGTTAGPAQTVMAYLVIAGPVDDVTGYEVAFDITGIVNVDLIWLSITWPVSAINVGDVTNQIVGFSLPVMPNDCGHALIGTLSFLNLNATDGYEILAGPTTPASIPGTPAYLAAGELTPLVFATDADGMGTNDSGWLIEGYGLAAVNRDAAIATEEATWSDVKGLFR